MKELVYLFAYFTGNGEGGMHLAVSEDGLAWNALSDAAFIQPASGLMRDPFLYLGPDDTFHLIWTTEWKSQTIGYASSKDLIHWSPQRSLEVMRGIDETLNCWAPEMIYDPAQEAFVIFWASTVENRFTETKGSSEETYNHRMWYTSTRDFQQLAAPQVWFDPGFSVIDATLVPHTNGSYKMICKDERLIPERKVLFVADAPSPIGPFSEPQQAFSPAWVEGPATLKIGDWTYVYFDVYREKRYAAMRTKDFQTWEDISAQVTFPPGARHGSIVPIHPSHLTPSSNNHPILNSHNLKSHPHLNHQTNPLSPLPPSSQ